MNCFPLPAFSDNYIWVVQQGQEILVVDPGEARPVTNLLREQGLRLKGILITHHHQDHIGGVPELVAQNPGVPVYGPPTITGVTHPVANGDSINFDDWRLELHVLAVPGHTLDHLAYFTPGPEASGPWLFCGDTLFACGCGRLFEGTPTMMLTSLDTLSALPDATKVYCTHEYTQANIRFALACEPHNSDLLQWRDEADRLRAANQPTVPTTLAHEKRVNPFLRTGEAEVQKLLSTTHNTPIHDRLSSFTVMRQWKNVF